MAKVIRILIVKVCTLILLAGCAHNSSKPLVSNPPPPVFPPQKVMQSGDYAGFLADNERNLQECQGGEPCELALFNLGFVHAYTHSPYYSPAKAVRYFEELTAKYPQSPWAFQANAWVDLLKKSMAAEASRRRLESRLKSRAGQLKAKDTELRSRETTINELQQQIQRARDIDLEMDQKERELLQ